MLSLCFYQSPLKMQLLDEAFITLSITTILQQNRIHPKNFNFLYRNSFLGQKFKFSCFLAVSFITDFGCHVSCGWCVLQYMLSDSDFWKISMPYFNLNHTCNPPWEIFGKKKTSGDFLETPGPKRDIWETFQTKKTPVNFQPSPYTQRDMAHNFRPKSQRFFFDLCKNDKNMQTSRCS